MLFYLILYRIINGEHSFLKSSPVLEVGLAALGTDSCDSFIASMVDDGEIGVGGNEEDWDVLSKIMYMFKKVPQ